MVLVWWSCDGWWVVVACVRVYSQHPQQIIQTILTILIPLAIKNVLLNFRMSALVIREIKEKIQQLFLLFIILPSSFKCSLRKRVKLD